MYEEEIENLKELIFNLEEEIQNDNNEEAAVTLDFIVSSCNSLAIQLKA